MSLPLAGMPEESRNDTASFASRAQPETLRVLVVAANLDGGAADAGAVELTRILRGAGHSVIVVSRLGRLVADVTAAGGTFIPLDVATNNPLTVLRNAMVLTRLARAHRCDVIHALGRSGAWSACIAARITGLPMLTTWYKGFREQNFFKRWYNGVMARGTRVIAVSEQLAHLIHDRYGTSWDKIAVVPCSIDLDRFNPALVDAGRVAAMRRAWGVTRDTKVILIAGRLLRRKGHHIVVKAMRRLKDLGLKDFLCVFVGEDRGRTHYTGELWDLVLTTDTMDVIRMAAPVADMPAAYAAASVVVSAAIQHEGVQRAILEAQAMGRPVVVSDLAAGSDVVLTTPGVPESRIAGFRFHSGDVQALAATLLRLFSMPEPARATLGSRGREWVLGHFDHETVAAQTLAVYAALK